MYIYIYIYIYIYTGHDPPTNSLNKIVAFPLRIPGGCAALEPRLSTIQERSHEAMFPVKNGGLTGKESMRTWRNSSAEMVVHELPGLVNIQKSMENHHSLMGKSAINGNFSIAMFVYQKVSSTFQFVS